MTSVLTARPGDSVDGILARAEALDQRLWHLPRPVAGAAAARSTLHGSGVSVSAVSTDLAQLEGAITCGAALRVRAVVVEAPALDGADPEEAADRLVRALHGPLVAGAPLAIRNGGGADDLLGFVAVEWVLSELPRLALWIDPAACLARQREATAPDPTAWLDAYAPRVGGMFVHGLGSSGRGGAHPTDDGPDWVALSSALAPALPRVLAMDPSLDESAITDALRYVRSL